MTLDSTASAGKIHKRSLSSSRGKRITIDSVLYVLRMADDPAGVTLNKLARKRYGNYRDASTVINKLVHCGMIVERITRDERQIPRISFTITEKGKSALNVFEGWQNNY